MMMNKNFGPCMCADICCPSCGPAQGNVRCPICGEWESDGGCENPEECQKEAERRDKEEALYQEKEYLQDQIITHYAKENNCNFWDVDEDIRYETRNLSLDELKEKVKALNL